MSKHYVRCYKVHFHSEKIPSYMEAIVSKAFMKHRREVCDVFNKYINSVNVEWDLTGKPAALGDYVEDINPEYVELIQKRIQPHIDKLNKHFLICRYKIDEIGDMTGYVPWIKNSKIWFDLEETEPI